MKKFVINNDLELTRLDVFLSDTFNLSRSQAQRQIKENLIKVNNKCVKSSYLLKAEDVVTVEEIEEEKGLIPVEMDLNIMYEDDDIIIINKDNGIVVHPGAGNNAKTLVHGLLFRTNQLSNLYEDRPGIVHRLDADTTGLLVIAKNNEAHNHLSLQFANRSVIRKYYALVWGVIYNDTGTIDAPIGRDLKNRQKYTVTSSNSKEAITHFRVIKRFKEATLLEVELDTGRTHQIRVHMQYIGHPIINDPVYSNKKTFDNSGQYLHAKTIGFIHPKTKQQVIFDSELPNYFIKMIDNFEK